MLPLDTKHSIPAGIVMLRANQEVGRYRNNVKIPGTAADPTGQPGFRLGAVICKYIEDEQQLVPWPQQCA